MQATKQIGAANPKVLTMRETRSSLRRRQEESERLVGELDLRMSLLRKQKKEELLRQQGLADLLGLTDDQELAHRLRRNGWVIVD